MTEYEKTEFWTALGRLYDTSVALRDSIAGLSTAVEALKEISESHERRLDRWEVTTQSLIEEFRRWRENK